MEKFNLTQRQKDVFDYLKAHYIATGVVPTHREMADHFKVSSTTIAKHMASLERRGWVKRAQGLRNGLVILD